MALTFGREKLKGTSKTQGDFNLQNRFSLEIDGVGVNGVHTVEGIETESDVVEYKDAKDWSNTLEWYTWRKAVLDGKTDRRSISVIFHDDAGVEVGRMNFYNCWPVKHTLPSFNAKNSGHATEQITISWETHEIKV